MDLGALWAPKYSTVQYNTVQYITVRGKPSFHLRDTTAGEVFKHIGDLKNSHAYGIGKIDAVTLKLAALVLAPLISHVINLSLVGTGVFPQKWKLTQILQLQKSPEADKLKPSSFRPVAQLPVISKLAKCTVQRQLLNYLEVTGQIAEQHHTYRLHCSTVTALLEMMDTIDTGEDDNWITFDNEYRSECHL